MAEEEDLELSLPPLGEDDSEANDEVAAGAWDEEWLELSASYHQDEQTLGEKEGDPLSFCAEAELIAPLPDEAAEAGADAEPLDDLHDALGGDDLEPRDRDGSWREPGQEQSQPHGREEDAFLADEFEEEPGSADGGEEGPEELLPTGDELLEGLPSLAPE